MKAGLLGRTLKHSFSPEIHNLLGDYSYELFEREEDEIANLLKDKELRGFNITIPYKTTIMKYCDEISPEAEKIGCVNTVVLEEKGKVKGYNTDYKGFIYMVKKSGINPAGKRAVILGDGATSETVEVALKDLGVAEIVKLSRKGEYKFSHAGRFKDFEIIVNCTPVGMYPKNFFEIEDFDINIFKNLECVLDLIYNPHRTNLIFYAMERKIAYSDGFPMLVAQAKYAAEYFLDRKIDDNIIEKIENKLRKNLENIVIVGMPGSGKSTIGRELSYKLKKDFVDIDCEIEKEYGSIEDIFSEKGEEYFREIEREKVAEFGKKSGIIISTGGGVVKDRDNYRHLKQNGRIYFLIRSLEKLQTEGRPLSQGGLATLEKLFEERRQLYMDFSDVIIENNNRVDITLGKILEDFNENIGN